MLSKYSLKFLEEGQQVGGGVKIGEEVHRKLLENATGNVNKALHS